jgi:hypothetical protein
MIDLEQPSGSRNDLQKLPSMMDTPIAGYLNGSIPLVCGKFISNNMEQLTFLINHGRFL